MAVMAPQPGVSGLSLASCSIARPQLLSHLSPAAAQACPDAPLIVAIVYQDAARPAVDDGTMLAVQRDRSAAVGAAAGDVGSLPGRSAIVVWDLSDTRAPAAVLICESTVQCCAFGPGTGGSVVIGGCQDGTLGLWDTRTKPHGHRACRTAGSKQTDRGTAAASTTPVFLPALTGSTSGLASSHAISLAKNGLQQAEAIVRMEALDPRNPAAGPGSNTHSGGDSVQRSGAEWHSFSVLVVSATATVAQWAVTVPGAGAGAGAAGGAFEAAWDSASASAAPLL